MRGSRHLIWLAFVLGGCAEVDPPDVAARSAALEDDVTIPRIPNPPIDLAALPGDLRGMPIPEPANLADFVADRQAAIALGKALFWDMQVGSDGVQACASCHFRAGADPRSRNQLSPGLKQQPEMDLGFERGGPNHQLTAADFPLSRLAVPGVRGALDPATDTNDAVASQGVHHPVPGELDPLGFSIGNANTRRVEPRNTPTIINAVYNHRQFWDGRAEAIFNGVNHLGTRDPNARVVRVDQPWAPTFTPVALGNASLASQALAPIVSDLEMSNPNATTLELSRLLSLRARGVGVRIQTVRPLAGQLVSKTDSVLGAMSRYPDRGLKAASYEQLIAAAFKPKWWFGVKLVQVAPNGQVSFVWVPDSDPATKEYTLFQYNFALFFGVAVQMYEATLIADDTPWDQFRRAHPTATDPALNPWTNTAPGPISRQALFGAHLFNDRTRGPTNIRCSNCHEEAELTDASSRRIAAATGGPVRVRDGNVIDKGFNNIGLRPTDNDLGVGGSDGFGPLSHTRRMFPGAPPATYDGGNVTKGFGVEGAFKVPSLRNVALTAPYFHNGDALTLHQAVELYGRGGNVAPIAALDGTPIEPLGIPVLTPDEVDALVAFLEALTDERVLYRRAPFDHPQLFVPNGHPDVLDANGDGRADDRMFEIPAVGAAGGPPIPGFLEGPFAN